MKIRNLNILGWCSLFCAMVLLAIAPCTLKAGEPSVAKAMETADADPEARAAGESEPETASPQIRKVLFIGDSMTGWMAERMNAYGEKNDFEVATVIWDGSTISKWASAQNLDKIIAEQNPDVIVVSLGMNEMFEQRPEARFSQPVSKLLDIFGDTPFLWIGPPSWPGHSEGEKFNSWMQNTLGNDRYFSSFNLELPRQSKSNPHPTREGIGEWMDEVMQWIPQHSRLNFGSLETPSKGEMSRGDVFIYKRMKENL